MSNGGAGMSLRLLAAVTIVGLCLVVETDWPELVVASLQAAVLNDSRDVVARFPASAPITYDSNMAKQWFDKTYFNLLVDYYPEISAWPYGTGSTVENVTRALHMCRPGYVIFYAKGQSGVTTFKSRLKTEHPKLGNDPLTAVRKATRQCGVKLILYYSGLIDGAAAERHLEWRPAGRDGRRDARPVASLYDRMAPICPSSRYLEDWVAVQLEEMITRYDPDGIWVDSDWGCPSCYCEDCKKLAVARFGDAEALGTDEFQDWVRNEYRRKFAATVRRLKPSCLYSAGNTNPAVECGLSNHMDYQSGDWFSPEYPRLDQSLAMRRYTTLGIPYEAMTCDTSFVKPLQTRSLPKSLDRMLQEGAGVLINGGKWCFWTYPMPNGALIPSQMRLAKACRDWAAEREDLWFDTQSARWTAVVNNAPGLPHTIAPGVCKALIQLHRSPDILHLRQVKDPIPYQLLALPNVMGVTRDQVAMLEKYVRDGGILLSIGSTIKNPGMEQLFGVDFVRDNALTKEGHVLLPDGSSACLVCDWSEVRPADAEVWWKLYQSWDHDKKADVDLNYPLAARLDEEKPAETGLPAVTARKLGHGLVVHVAGDPFSGFWTFGHPTVRAFSRNLLDRMQPDPLLRTNAPSWMEASLRTRGDELFVHFLNGNPGVDMSEVGCRDLYIDEIPEVGPYQASIRCPQRPVTVFLEPGHRPLNVRWHDGRLDFVLPRLKIHACVRIRPWTGPI
jgi:hypothetical protein